MASGLTKTQLVRHLAEKVELPNKTVSLFLEQLADVAVKETKKNGVFVVPGPVSYTHLDVYKRQVRWRPWRPFRPSSRGCGARSPR